MFGFSRTFTAVNASDVYQRLPDEFTKPFIALHKRGIHFWRLRRPLSRDTDNVPFADIYTGDNGKEMAPRQSIGLMAPCISRPKKWNAEVKSSRGSPFRTSPLRSKWRRTIITSASRNLQTAFAQCPVPMQELGIVSSRYFFIGKLYERCGATVCTEEASGINIMMR